MKPESVLDAISPGTWMRLKALRVFDNSTERAQRDDVQLSASQRLGVVPQSFLMAEEDQKYMLALSGTDNFKHVEVGDFVISLRSFEGGFEYSAHKGCVSPAYTVLRPKLEIDGFFWRHLFKSEVFKQMLAAFNVGIRDGKSIRYEDFSEFTLALPNLTEQLNLSNYLDRETANIDGLVSKKARFIELLREKRQALITHAVTKGLDSNVKMKDSGVEWLGEVPEHWTVTPIKYFATHIGSGKTPSGGAEVYQDSGILFLRSQNVHNDGLRLDDAAFISAEIDAEMKGSRVQQNDVLLNITGASIGRSCIVPKGIPAANVNQHVCIVRTHEENLAQWISAYFISDVIQAQIDFSQNGAGREGLNFEQIGNMLVALPPDSEREAIKIALGFEIPRLDTLLRATERSIELLKERRSALITAAVTGQIDVREYPARRDKLAA